MEAQEDTDTGTGTGTGTDKGLSASCSDIICKHCNERIWHDGQEVKQIRVMLSRHMSANNRCCRPNGVFKPAEEAKILMEKMMTNKNLLEVRGGRDCDFLRREDADDSHECSSCGKLFSTFDQADHHAKYTTCKDNQPPPRAIRTHCHMTVGGTLVRAVRNTRRRLDSTFAAVPVPITPAVGTVTGTDMPPPAPAAPSLQDYTNSGEFLQACIYIFILFYLLFKYISQIYVSLSLFPCIYLLFMYRC